MSAEYVYRMEDLLETYATPDTPDTPDTPLVCLDEKPVTLHADLYAGTPPTPDPPTPDPPEREGQGHRERRDYAYARRGCANLFVLVAPQQGWRHVAGCHRSSGGSRLR
jgi:hypothetical protein